MKMWSGKFSHCSKVSWLKTSDQVPLIFVNFVFTEKMKHKLYYLMVTLPASRRLCGSTTEVIRFHVGTILHSLLREGRRKIGALVQKNEGFIPLKYPLTRFIFPRSDWYINICNQMCNLNKKISLSFQIQQSS